MQSSFHKKLSALISVVTAAVFITPMLASANPVSINAGSLEFGEVLIEQMAPVKEWTITNNTNTDIEVSLEIQGDNASLFQLRRSQEFSLKANESKPISIEALAYSTELRKGSGEKTATLLVKSSLTPTGNPEESRFPINANFIWNIRVGGGSGCQATTSSQNDSSMLFVVAAFTFASIFTFVARKRQRSL